MRISRLSNNSDSILKETSDLAYVFFVLVLGISVGMGHYSLALLTTLFLSMVIYLFNKFGFGNVSDNFDYLLLFSGTNDVSKDKIQMILDDNVTSRELLHVKHHTDNLNEYAYSLRLKKNIDPVNVSQLIKKIQNVSRVELLTGKNTSEF